MIIKSSDYKDGFSVAVRAYDAPNFSAPNILDACRRMGTGNKAEFHYVEICNQIYSSCQCKLSCVWLGKDKNGFFEFTKSYREFPGGISNLNFCP